VNGDSLCHTLTLDIPIVKKFRRHVDFRGGHSPFFYVAAQQVIFDAETRSFYYFPEFKSSLVSSDLQSRDWPQIILLTKTHIIVLFHDVDPTVSPVELSTLVQAFTVPTDSRPVHNGTGVLRLSHEGVIPGDTQNVDLIRNSIVDVVSGATSIRLLRQCIKSRRNLHFSCIDLTLHRHSSTDTILPMIIDLHDIANVSHGYNPSNCYVDSSDEGHARGLWRFFAPRDATSDRDHIDPIMRFTIDASQDKCVAVLGPLLNPQWRQIGDPRWHLFDGVRGRLYHYNEGLRITNIR